LTVVGWISFACGFSIKALGIDARMGGHCVVTNVGAMKFQEGIAPFTPWLHAQLMCCIGTVQKKPVVDENGEIKVGNVVVMNSNIDHRYGDAGLFAPGVYLLLDYIKDPKAFKMEDHFGESDLPLKSKVA